MEFLKKHKGKVLASITVVMIIIIYITGYYNQKSTFIGDALGYIVAPAQQYLSKFSGWIEDKVGFWKNAKELEEKNNELLTEIDNLKTELNRLKMYEKDYNNLAESLKLKDKYATYFNTGAEVIGKNVDNWYKIFYIDKGHKDSLSNGMVVLAQSGLVGKITKTSAKYSTVLSIIDDTSAVSAKILRTDDVGILKGDSTLINQGLCKMVRIDADAEIIVGDEVVTSNLGNYPPGITIGYIKEVTTDKDGLTKSALIEPVVDFKHIDTVIVINGKEDYTSED